MKPLIAIVIGALLLFTKFTHGQSLRGGVPDTLPGVTVISGQYSSINEDNDALRCVERASGLSVYWTFYPTARLLRMAAIGDLDVIYPMGFSADRDQYLHRSKPLFSLNDLWVYKEKRPALEDAEHVVVAAKFGSPQQDFLTAKKYRFLSGVNGYDNMLKMLERGNIEAFALPEAALNTIVKDIAWQPKTEVLLKRDVGFYLPLKGDPTLAKILDEAVQKCRR